jgi:K+-sensing histidine kinase KdpD
VPAIVWATAGPITAILGSALVLEDGDRLLEDDKRADLVHGIAMSARDLNRLVTDLLDLDRPERGIVEPAGVRRTSPRWCGAWSPSSGSRTP